MTSWSAVPESDDGTETGVACGIEGKVSAKQSRNPMPGVLSTEPDQKRDCSFKKHNQMQAWGNNCTCLAEAIWAIMPDKKKAQVFLDICLAMPKIGDTSMRCANKVLVKHGMILRRTNATYN